MPAELRDAVGQLLVSGTKIIEERGTRDEHGQRALGARDARFEYQDHQTGLGALLAVDRLTNLRTGAAAAWSARYVVGTAEVVAVIGAGRVAQATIEAVDRLLRPAEIRFTSRSAERREGVCQALAPRLTARLTAVGDVATATAGAPVVIAAIPAEAPGFTTFVS